MSETPDWVQKVTGDFTAAQIYRAAIDAGWMATEVSVLLNRLQYNRELAYGREMRLYDYMKERQVTGRVIEYRGRKGFVTDWAQRDEDYVFVMDGLIELIPGGSVIRVWPVPEPNNG